MTGPDMSWIEYLPSAELGQMQRDLAAATTQEERDQLLHEWKSTALVWADPELVAILTSDAAELDLVDAPRPEAPPKDEDGL